VLFVRVELGGGAGLIEEGGDVIDRESLIQSIGDARIECYARLVPVIEDEIHVGEGGADL
jgi:hypothetical protein